MVRICIAGSISLFEETIGLWERCRKGDYCVVLWMYVLVLAVDDVLQSFR